MNPFKFLTDMEDRGQVLDEMQKKYKNTILLLRRKDAPATYVTYRGCSDNQERVYFYTLTTPDNQYATIEMFYDEEAEVTIPKPELGCYTANGKLVVLQTLPHRQWRKGLCSGNTSIQYVFEPGKHAKSNSFDYCIGEVLLNNQAERTVDDALAYMSKEPNTVGVHITRNFGLIENFFSTDDFVFLYHFKNLIGLVYPKENKIVIENKTFLQEVLDTQNSWCSNYRIEV